MTKVIFYTDIANRQKFLYRFLYRKIFKARSTALVYADKDLIAHLDEALWKEQGFLPHYCLQPPYSGDDSTSIALTSIAPTPSFYSEVLISLSDELPAFVSRFPVYVDIVGQVTEEKAHARTRYKYLKDHGYDIVVHRLSSTN